MTLKKYIYVLMAGMLCFTSCSLNELPEFNDKDAFVAFDSSSMSVGEETGEVKIPVTLASIAGLSGTAEFAFDAAASTAKLGEHFTIKNSSNSLSFGSGSTTQYIEIGLIDNDDFTGDLSATFKIVSSSVNLGANVTCRLSIVDNEHPLLKILGTYSGNLTSYWEDVYSNVEIRFEKDEEDPSKVWISNLDPYFASYDYVAPDENFFYGIVNEDLTEIHIPVGQDMGYTAATITLQGLDNPDPDAGTELPAGGSIIIDVLEDGAKLKFRNAWGVHDGVEFWELYVGDAILTKR